MEKNKRDLLKKTLSVGLVGVTAPVWYKPVINAVVLPAHAQTSCTLSNAVGTWTVTLDGSDILRAYVLDSDGTGNYIPPSGPAIPVTWTFSNQTLDFSHNDGTTATAVFNSSCTSFSGNITFVGFPATTFTAT